MARLEDLSYSNSTLRALPVEADKARSHTPHQVPYVFSLCTPTPLRKPTLVAVSQAALALLGLDPTEVSAGSSLQLVTVTLNHKLAHITILSFNQPKHWAVAV